MPLVLYIFFSELIVEKKKDPTLLKLEQRLLEERLNLKLHRAESQTGCHLNFFEKH